MSSWATGPGRPRRAARTRLIESLIHSMVQSLNPSITQSLNDSIPTLAAFLYLPASRSAGGPTVEPGHQTGADREIPEASNLCRDIACNRRASSISPAFRPYKQDRSDQRCLALPLLAMESRPYKHSP